MIQSGNLFFNYLLDHCGKDSLLYDMLKHHVTERWRPVWIHSITGKLLNVSISKLLNRKNASIFKEHDGLH